MSDQSFPTMTDGRSTPRQPVVKCWNLVDPTAGTKPRRFDWLKDALKYSSYSVDHLIESTGEPIGGFTGAGLLAGSVTVLNNDVSLPDILPAYVLSIVKGSVLGWYVVKENDSPQEGKTQVNPTLSVSRLINPFFSTLLSPDEGDTLRITKSIAAMAATETLACSPVNTRTGATLACALAALGDTTIFPGIAIAPTTGIITFTKAAMAVGVYELDVTCSDTLLNKRTLIGGNRLVVTVTA